MTDLAFIPTVKSTPTPCVFGNTTSSATAMGNVHEGFLAGYTALATKIKTALASLPTTYTLQIAGSGYGAALATLAALDLVTNTKFNAFTLTTFGSPAIGDYAFVTAFQTMVKAKQLDTWRYIHRQLTQSSLIAQLDPVSELTNSLGYLPIGNPAYIESAGTNYGGATAGNLDLMRGVLSNLMAVIPQDLMTQCGGSGLASQPSGSDRNAVTMLGWMLLGILVMCAL